MARRSRMGQVETFEETAARLSQEKADFVELPSPDQLNLGARFMREAQDAYNLSQQYRYGDPRRESYMADYWRLKEKAQEFASPRFRLNTDRIVNEWLNGLADRSAAEVNLAVRAYWSSFLKGAISFDMYARDDLRSTYIGSAFAVKPDPLGRFTLMDIRFGGNRSYAYLSGANKIILGSGTASEGDRHFDGEYARQHGLPGARVIGAGIGATLYMGTALGASMMYEGVFGTASPSPDHTNHGRTDEADGVWDGLNDHGSATREYDKVMDTKETETNHCVSVQGDEVEIEGDYTTYTGTIQSDEICGDVIAEYEGVVGEGEVDKLPASALAKSKFMAFPSHGSGIDPLGSETTLRFDMDSRWNGTSDDAVRRPRNYRAFDDAGIYDTDTKSLYPKLRPVTVEMLVRAQHGSSLQLIMFIAGTIKHNLAGQAGEDMVVTYLSRPDIAKIGAQNPRYLELIGQQVLPGLGGLSLDARREVARATRFAGLGGMTYTGGNPMNFPKPSRELVSLVKSFKYGG